MPNDYLQCENCGKYNQRCSGRCCCNPCQPKPYPPKCCPYSCIGPVGERGPTGPQGPQGMQGPQGASGPQGIQGPAGPNGLAATIAVEDASRVPFDNNPYVINVGTPNAAILRFGIPAGTPGTNGEPGSDGEDGKSAYQIALDNGFVGTETEWLDSLKGEIGPIAAMVPFSISKYGANLSVGEDGEPLMIAFSGFSPGYASTAYLQEGEWESGSIRIREGTYFPTSFVMTFNGTLKKMYTVFSSNDNIQIEDGVSLRPFACLAISTADELVYQILPETIVYADPYEGGVLHPPHTIRKGSRTDLNTTIPEGALVAIITGIKGTGMAYETSMTLTAGGGLYLE